MKIKKLDNGQIEVSNDCLFLIQTNIGSLKINDCFIRKDGVDELKNEHDPIFKPLFIALVNYNNSIN